MSLGLETGEGLADLDVVALLQSSEGSFFAPVVAFLF